MKLKIAYDQILFFIAFLFLGYVKHLPLFRADSKEWAIEMIFSVVFALIILTVRSNIQLFFSHLAGDINIKIQRQFKPFSLKFIDWIGILPLIFFQMGWGRPASSDKATKGPLSFQRSWVILSGPISNIIMAVLIYMCVSPLENISLTLAAFAQLFAKISLQFGLLNLLPVPPFDGAFVVGALLKKNMKPNVGRNYGLMLLLILFSYDTIQNLIRWIAEKIFNLLNLL